LTLAKWMGHSSTRVTERYYHKAKSETANKVRDGLSALYKTVAQQTRTPLSLAG
jgi:hypothetical protein